MACRAAESTDGILRSWLAAYNTGDPAALKTFQQHYLGNDDIDFAEVTREETGGLDLIRVESDDPLKTSALLRERNSPATWRVTLQREAPTTERLQRLDLRALPTSQSEALADLAGYASRLAAADEFSGVVLVSRGGNPLLAKAWGLADRKTKTPVTLDTQFLLGSAGKMFTAVGVLQLIEAGKVSLDAPIGKYLTDYPNAEVAQKVTIRDLLTHQGGTGQTGILEVEDTENRGTVHSIADIIRLNGTRGPAFPPGSKWEYSNYGFILLGALIEKVSGEDYYDYVLRHVFQPAGMTHSGYPLRGHMEAVAVGYTTALPDGAFQSNTDVLPWRGTPAGGGVSTANDVVRFFAALNSGKLISKSMLAEATRKQTRSYGYGFISATSSGFPYWGHGGGAPGTSTVLDYLPVTDTTLVCLSNRDPEVCDHLALNYVFRAPRTP